MRAHIGTDLGLTACQFKLIGALIHSHALIIHIVYPHIPDNANLLCHVLDESIDEAVRVRTNKGLKE